MAVDKSTGTVRSQVGIKNVTLDVTGSAAALNADAIAATDVSLYRWVSVQVTGTFSGTVTFQGSNDNSTWVSVSLMTAGSLTTAPVVSATAAGLWGGPLNYKHFRVRMTAYTSGTAVGTALFSATASTLPGITSNTVAAAGTIAHDAADSGNPVKIGGKANSGIPTAVSANNDRVDAWYDTRGQAMVELRDSSGAEFGTAAAPVRTDPTGTTSQPVSATDLDVRDLVLTQDSVRQTQRPMSSYVAAQSSADGTVIAANVTAPTRVRILRLDGGSKPSNLAASFCTVTIALGATNVFVKELQVGEPIGGQVCLEGAAGEDLTVTVTGTGTVQFNLRYETFT